MSNLKHPSQYLVLYLPVTICVALETSFNLSGIKKLYLKRKFKKDSIYRHLNVTFI